MAAQATDPVCGMTVDPRTAAGHATHEGTEYHFCSRGCQSRFQADPQRFLSGGREPMGNATGPPHASAPGSASAGAAGGSLSAPSLRDYAPLIAVVLMILAATAALAIRDALDGTFTLRSAISNFMAGFFLAFAGFKLMDLRGFADGYATYDLLARRVPAYAFVYPFVELGFGLSMLVGYEPDWLLWTEVGVMAFSGVGVVAKLAKHEPFQCACLGTFLKVPLTKVTVIEDFGMAALALALLLMP